MPWKARSAVSLREEFVRLAGQGEAMAALCRRFGISRKTGYKWVSRCKAWGWEGLQDHSRRPHSSPAKSADTLEVRVVELRQRYPAWGGRKLRKLLEREDWQPLPASSTITEILHRHALIFPEESQKHQAFQRFERAQPNELWQLDFKGHVAMGSGRCHPLTMLDDHSRYAVGLFACGDERTQTVQERFRVVFRRYGLPQAILCDNGPPWGSAGGEEKHTELTVWLMQQGVRVLHGRAYHPQTQGKDERFHRTLKNEVLWDCFADLLESQKRFDQWRKEYNWVRPHEALGMDVPGTRYQCSKREFVEHPQEPEYDSGQLVRKVDASARISLWNQSWKIGKPFAGHRILIEPTPIDHLWDVYFYGIKIQTLDRRSV